MKLIKDLGFVLTSANNKKKYNCGLYLCNCGNEFITRHEYVKSGHTKSCGCLAKKINAERLKTHGMANTKLYKSWCHMKERCFVKKDKSYKNYGGRGITICDEWRNNFMAFYDWSMANGYEEHLTIDRINNDGNYEPSNCRWVNGTIQASNRRILKSTNTSGYKGITKTKYKKWRSVITIERKTIHLGCFKTKIEAAIAYDKHVIENNLPHTTNGLYSRQGD